MTLLTDGVPEARASDGKLLGFDQLGRLTLSPAEAIADAAQAFGQDDDITVVTIALQPE
jgi:serine phosphatase RsbU (regulator of sigma subunit)